MRKAEAHLGLGNVGEASSIAVYVVLPTPTNPLIVNRCQDDTAAGLDVSWRLVHSRSLRLYRCGDCPIAVISLTLRRRVTWRKPWTPSSAVFGAIQTTRMHELLLRLARRLCSVSFKVVDDADSPWQRARELSSLKEQGNEAFKTGNNELAKDLYTQALAVDTKNSNINSKLYYNRALVLAKVCVKAV